MGAGKTPRLKFTKEVYAALVAAFRLKPGDMQHAGEAAGVSAAQAGRAWRGDPTLLATHPWAEPIEKLIDQAGEIAIKQMSLPEVYRHPPGTQPSARRLAALAEADAALKAEKLEAEKQAYLEQIIAEKRMIVSMREDVQGWAETARNLRPMQEKLSLYIARAAGEQLETGDITPRYALELLTKSQALSANMIKCGEAVHKLMRLDRGQSTENVSVRVRSDDMTDEEAEEILATAASEVRALGMGTGSDELAVTPDAELEVDDDDEDEDDSEPPHLGR